MLHPPSVLRRLIVAALLVALATLYAVPLAHASAAAHLAASASAAPAGALIIDHFDAAQGPLVSTLGNPQFSSVSGPNVLGAERDVRLTVSSGTPGSVTMQASSSDLLHSQDTGIIAQTLLQWDGADASSALNPTGLGGLDLTQANTQNGLMVKVLLNDLPINLKFTVYSGGNSSTATLPLPGGQPVSAGPRDYYIPFAAFTPLAGFGADFTTVGAIELLIDGYNDAADLTLDLVRTTDFDWGDLPDSSLGGPNYPTKYAADGPRHVIGSLYLGAQIDPHELNGVPSLVANGDDNSGVDDEDGVQPTPGIVWTQGPGGGAIDVTVTGGPGCLSGWLDWNGDGDLLGAGESVLANVLVNSGASTHTIDVPVDPSNRSFFARFRLYAPDAGGTCTSARTPTGQAINGEVEDYQWPFSPTAVNISVFRGRSTPATLPVVSGLVTLVGALYITLRRSLRS